MSIAEEFIRYREKERALAPPAPRRKLTASEFERLDRAADDVANLRDREREAAERERMLSLTRRSAVPTVTVPARSGSTRLEPVTAAVTYAPAWPKQLHPVPDFVLGVFKHLAAWETAPLFVHARFIRDIRKLANSMEDDTAIQMGAVDALADAVAPIAVMHSTWSALHTAARRLVVRLESPFGDGEDDVVSLHRLQRKLFNVAALSVMAHIVEQRRWVLNLPEPAEVAAPKPASPAERHAEALRAAVARGDLAWTGERRLGRARRRSALGGSRQRIGS